MLVTDSLSEVVTIVYSVGLTGLVFKALRIIGISIDVTAIINRVSSSDKEVGAMVDYGLMEELRHAHSGKGREIRSEKVNGSRGIVTEQQDYLMV